MSIYSPGNTAEQNLETFSNFAYPGRFLALGYVSEGDLSVVAYGITARSEPSQNRRLIVEDNIAGTEVADPTKPFGQPELTVYDAMRRVGDIEIVSNGDQTDRVVRYLRSGGTFLDAMDHTFHEPDSLLTPRITGFVDLDPVEEDPEFGLSIILPADDTTTEDPKSVRKFWSDMSPGISEIAGLDENIVLTLQTYGGSEEHPLPFDEDPFALPVPVRPRRKIAENMAGMLWENLDSRYRLSVMVKVIDGEGKVEFAPINKYPRAEEQ